MSKENKRYIEDIIDEVEYDKEVERKCILSNTTIWSLYVQELLYSSFVYYHLCYVFVLILLGDL